MATAKRASLVRPIALIVLDIDLPGGNGVRFCTWAKGKPELAHVAVVLCSGSDDPQMRHLALEAGAVDFVAEPFDIQELRQRIRFYLHGTD